MSTRSACGAKRDGESVPSFIGGLYQMPKRLIEVVWIRPRSVVRCVDGIADGWAVGRYCTRDRLVFVGLD